MNSPLANIAQQERMRREILHKSDLIPPLPELVVRLLALLNKQDTEPVELEEHLAQDQVLVAKMLAMVNSPFYGLNRSITNIRDAIMVLGFRGLRSLILASSTAKYMARDYTCYGHDSKGLWKHSLAVAAGARSIATHCGLDRDASEELFVTGLLHDVGKMMLAPSLLDHNAEASTFPGTITELERSMVGLDHTEAGALIAAKWNLSSLIQEGIKHHHDSQAPEALERELAVVRLANAFAHSQGHGYLPERVPESKYAPEDLDALELTQDSWETFCGELEETVQAALNKLAKIIS